MKTLQPHTWGGQGPCRAEVCLDQAPKEDSLWPAWQAPTVIFPLLGMGKLICRVTVAYAFKEKSLF